MSHPSDSERAPLLSGGDKRNGQRLTTEQEVDYVQYRRDTFSARSGLSDRHSEKHRGASISVQFGAEQPAVEDSRAPNVTCRVCHQSIEVGSRAKQHVIKCDECKEATPIRPPPLGQKYVRCPCNCLLICKATSLRIACPRPECKRVITLGIGPNASSGLATRAPPGTCRVRCAHCSDMFMYSVDHASYRLARCPVCHKVSSVGPKYARMRALCFALIALSSALLCAGVVFATWDITHHRHYHGFYVLWSGLVLLCAILIARTCYYATIRISHIDGPL